MEFGSFNRRDRDKDRGGFRERSDNRDRDRGFDRNRGGGGGFRERSDNRDRDRGFDRNRGGGGGFRERSGGFQRDRNRDNDFRDRSEMDESVFSKRVRAGKRRTYFFDVKKTRGNDFFITITESTKKEDGFGYKRHKLFLYKEDFNRFVTTLNEVVSHVKEDLMPDFDYEEFDRRQAEWEAQNRDAEDDDIDDQSEVDFRDEALDEQNDDDASPKKKSKDDDDDDVNW